MRSLVPAYLAFLLLAGCVTTPDGGHELTAAGRVALQEVASITSVVTGWTPMRSCG